MFKPVGLDVQLLPSYSSVAPVSPGREPPKAKAAVCVPQPAKASLAVFILPGDVAQFVPSYSSVAVEAVGVPTAPPNANAAV